MKNKKGQEELLSDFFAFIAFIFISFVFMVTIINPGCGGSGVKAAQQRIDGQIIYSEMTGTEFNTLKFLESEITVNGKTQTVADFIVEYYYEDEDEIKDAIEADITKWFFDMHEGEYDPETGMDYSWEIEVRDEDNDKLFSFDNEYYVANAVFDERFEIEIMIPTPTKDLRFIVKKFGGRVQSQR
ncbi:MAG: hypothetical protein GY861_09955 [bacterium]|nr:hypothetical protein [bacterium]